MKQLSYITVLILLQLLSLNYLKGQNTIPISGINSIEISGVIPVVLVQDDNEFMDLSQINDEWREILKYSIKDNVLKINSNKKGTAIQKKTPLTIHIKDLSEIKLERIAVISNQGVLKTNSLNIKLEGVSTVRLYLDVTTLKLHNTGASNITLEGKTKDAIFDLEGVSQTNCKDFAIDSLQIDAKGASTGKIKVVNAVSGEIGGVSSIEIIGNPELDINYSGIHSIGKNSSDKYYYETNSTRFALGKDSTILHVDTTSFKWGKKTIIIFTDSTKSSKPFNSPRLKWAGFDIGLNGLMNSNGSTDMSNPAGTLPKDRTDFMEIDLRHSWMIRINILEFNLRTKNERFGVLTGLGFEWNSYDLKNNVRLIAKGRSFIDPSPNQLNQNYTYGIVDTTVDFSKNRLKTFKLNVPALFEINLGKEKDFYIVGGGILGLNLKSKMKYKSSNGKEKLKEDFNINPITASLYAKIGYEGTALFATYGLSSLFEKNDGPQVYPFSMGLSFNL